MKHNGIYRDSRNYVPIDLEQGIDIRTKTVVNGEAFDPHFELLPRCAYCKYFITDSRTDEPGSCQKAEDTPYFATYPQMVAVSCNYYEEKKHADH